MSTSVVSPATVGALLLLDGGVLAFCANSDRCKCGLSLRRGMNRSGRHVGELEYRFGDSGVVVRPPADKTSCCRCRGDECSNVFFDDEDFAEDLDLLICDENFGEGDLDLDFFFEGL